MHECEIVPVRGPVFGSVRPPGSKSLTNRALVLAALANGETTLTGVLHSRDTEVMIDSLKRLGFSIEQNLETQTVRVIGRSGKIPATTADLWLENSGTSIRFLAAMCTLGHGRFRLDGNTRMRQRPILDLLTSLQQLGVDAQCESVSSESQPASESGCPPVIISSSGLKGGTARMDPSLSSQFLSALLLAAPCATSPITIELTNLLVSEPYIAMTIGIMRQFGVSVEATPAGGYLVNPQTYRAQSHYHIEPDASAASYFFGLAAVTQGEITVEGLNRTALQGDIEFVSALQRMGCTVKETADSITVVGGPLKGIDIDMNGISDTAQTLAAVAVFAEGPTTIRNVAHMRHKETDRVHAVVTELRRAGIQAEEFADGLTVYPGTPKPTLIETYDDHRMAMSFSLLGLRAPGIRIADPGCTAKTYPDYFQVLDRLCAASR